jgi:hypothetical protein
MSASRPSLVLSSVGCPEVARMADSRDDIEPGAEQSRPVIYRPEAVIGVLRAVLKH